LSAGFVSVTYHVVIAGVVKNAPITPAPSVFAIEMMNLKILCVVMCILKNCEVTIKKLVDSIIY